MSDRMPFYKVIAWLMVFAVFHGCAGLTAKKNKKLLPKESVSDSVGESAYYYYLESEIQKQKGNIETAIEYMDKAVSADPNSLFLLKEQALLFLMANRTNKAVDLLESIIKKAPRDVESLIMLGRVKQLLNHNQQEIIDIYHKVISIDPSQQTIYLMLGNIYLGENDLDNALKVFETLVRKFPDAYAGYFYLGGIYKDQKKFKKAEAAFLKSVEIEPNLIEARFEMVDLYPNSPKKKIAIFNEIMKIDPENIEAQAEAGLLLQQTGQGEKASQIFMKLAQASKQDENVLPRVVKRFIDSERFEDMTTVLEGMAEASPDNTDVYFFLGMASDNLKEYDAAISYFNMIDDTSGFYVKAAIHLAFIHHDMGQTTKSIEILENALSLHPENTEIMVYLSTFHEEQKNYLEAERILQKGLKLDASNPTIHFYLGILYDKMGKSDLSIEEMKTVIRLDPKNANALNYLGYSYADRGINLDEAEQLIIRALLYKPDDGYITDSLGWVYYKKKLYEKAVSFLEKALELVPEDPLILEHMGDAYMKANQPDKALKTYKKALKFKHKDPKSIQIKIKQISSPPPSK